MKRIWRWFYSLESKSLWWLMPMFPGLRCSPAAVRQHLRDPFGIHRWCCRSSCSEASPSTIRRRQRVHLSFSASVWCCCCSTEPEPRSIDSIESTASPWAGPNIGRALEERETVASTRRISPSGTRRCGWWNGRPPHLIKKTKFTNQWKYSSV